MFTEGVQMKGTVVFVRPVIVGFDLTALLLSSQHDDNANILLPHDLPEVLYVISM
jgi:hypothetical protein